MIKEKYADYYAWNENISIVNIDSNQTEKKINKLINGELLLKEYMNNLGLTEEDLEGSMSTVKAKIRDNKISKIIK